MATMSSAEIISIISLLLNGALTLLAAIVLFVVKRYLSKHDMWEEKVNKAVRSLEDESVKIEECRACNDAVAQSLREIANKIDAGFKRSATSDMVLAKAMLQICEQIGSNGGGGCEDIKRLYDKLKENVIWDQID